MITWYRTTADYQNTTLHSLQSSTESTRCVSMSEGQKRRERIVIVSLINSVKRWIWISWSLQWGCLSLSWNTPHIQTIRPIEWWFHQFSRPWTAWKKQRLENDFVWYCNCNLFYKTLFWRKVDERIGKMLSKVAYSTSKMEFNYVRFAFSNTGKKSNGNWKDARVMPVAFRSLVLFNDSTISQSGASKRKDQEINKASVSVNIMENVFVRRPLILREQIKLWWRRLNVEPNE